MNANQTSVGVTNGVGVPHITLNELSKYVWAGDRQRRSIVNRQKRQNTKAITHYRKSEPIIQFGFACGFEGTAFDGRLWELTDGWDPMPSQLNKKLDNIAAVNHARDCLSLFPLREASFEPVSLSQPAAMIISGVRVSVRPEVIIRGSSGAVNGKTGAIKFYMSKNCRMKDTEMAVGAALLHRYMAEKFGETNVSSEHCYMLDVFAGDVRIADASAQMLMPQIEAACADIAKRWIAVAA